MLEVKSSVGKHESDIPLLKVDDTLADFFAQRQVVINKLKTMDDAQKQAMYENENAVLPVLLAAMDVICLQDIPEQSVELIFALEKKFVLFGKLSTHYSPTYKPLNDQIHCPDVYICLAAMLLRYFFDAHDINALNSAIRVLDKVCLQIEKHTPIENIARLINVLNEEKRALRELSHV